MSAARNLSNHHSKPFPLDSVKMFVGYDRLRFLTITGLYPTHLVGHHDGQWFVWDHTLTRGGPFEDLTEAICSVPDQVDYEKLR